MKDEQPMLLPAAIIDDWEKRLHEAGCSEQNRIELKNVIHLTLPYPSRISVEVCATGYTAACYDKPAVGPDTSIVSSVLAQLELAGQLQPSNRHAQSHPVAAGIKKITAAAAARQVAPDPWLSFFIGQCQQAMLHAEAMTPTSYYRHTVYVRDVMLYIMQSQVTGSLPADEPVADACLRLKALFTTAAETGEPMPIPTSSVNNLDVKIDVICQLLDGTLSFGVPSVKRSPKEATDSNDKSATTGGKSTPQPRYRTPFPEELKKPRPRPTVPRRQSLAYALDEGVQDIPQPRTRPARASVQADPDACVDSEVIEQVLVDWPPELAPSERRKRFVNLLHVQAAQNTPSRADMQRFSRRQLSTWLGRFADEDPLSAGFLLLSWTLGMTPERLATLRVSTQMPTGEAVSLNPHTHWLSYRILNLGATSTEGATEDNAPVPATHLMQLALPASLVALIVAADDEEPFLGLEKSYPTLRNRVEKAAGTRPCSLTQWAASTPAFDAERFNLLETAAKRGQVAFNEIASSAYRTQDLAALNAKFSERLVALSEYWDAEGLMTGPGAAAFRNLAVTTDVPEGLIGSQRYAPPEDLVPVVRAIRNATKQKHQRLNDTFKIRPLKDLLALINLQALNFFLVLQLHSVGRPLNRKTRIGIGPEGLWVSDKASHRYCERKVICAIGPGDVEKGRGLLLEQRQHCRQSQHKLAGVAQRLGIAVKLAEPDVIDLPCVFTYLPSDRSIKVDRMTPARWQLVIDESGLSEKWTTAANVFRHIASTELSQFLSDAVVDEVLGHKHPGRDWWGSESCGTMPELAVMAPVIEAWADRMGLRVVKLDDRIFGGFYAAP